MELNIGGMIGLYGGMLCGLWGWWYGRRKAREKRGLDELHDHIWQKARSYSWYTTLVAIYVFFSLLMFGVQLNSAIVLGLLMIIHLASWAFIGIGLTTFLQHTIIREQVIGIGIIIFTTFTVTILSFTLSDWRILLIVIPLIFIALFFIYTSKSERKQT